MAAGADEFELDPAALARAEAALAALTSDYIRWMEADMASLRAALDALREAGPAEAPERCRQLFAVAHNMKGQAGTFGYPLLTRLGNALCRLLEGSAAGGAVPLARLGALVDAMGEVVAGRLDGDGGVAGRDLLLGLEGEGVLSAEGA
ncbi:MAG: Hpt domain-containing protein [Magnetospirillum sp.]|nr:Hpt domain-containing protein [Magnetospirillum sp.]